jgi:hypothetical protein
MTYSQIKAKRTESEPMLEQRFNRFKYGFALLQMQDEKRTFGNFEDSEKLLGKALDRSDYQMVAAVELAKDKFDEIVKLNRTGIYGIANYVFEAFNDSGKDIRDENYYGTSASVSDIVLVKEDGKVTVLYVQHRGFKELTDFKLERGE